MKSICDRIKSTVVSRGSNYAHPRDNHQTTADMWTSFLRARGVLEPTKFLSAEDVCALNVLQKMSRLGNGHHEDSWVDVAGYTENVAMLDQHQLNINPVRESQSRAVVEASFDAGRSEDCG